MKHFLSIILFFVIGNVYSQSTEPKNGLGLFQGFTDPNVALLKGKWAAMDSSITHNTRISYERNLSPTWAFSTGINTGFINNLTQKENFLQRAFSVGGDVAIFLKLNNGKIIKQTAFIGPFLVFGYKADYVPYLMKKDLPSIIMQNQYGLGINFRLSKYDILRVQSTLNQRLNDNFNTSLQHTAGFVRYFGKKHSELLPSMVDTDNDGVMDSEDLCKDVYGFAQFNGCPQEMTLVKKQGLDSMKSVNERLALDLVLAKNKTESLKDSLVNIRTNIYKGNKENDSSPRNATTLNTKDAAKINTTKVEVELPENELPQGYMFFVITMSAKNIEVAENWKRNLLKDFSNALIIPTSNGFYRVGIPAGTNKAKAVEVLDRVRLKGYSPCWLGQEKIVGE